MRVCSLASDGFRDRKMIFFLEIIWKLTTGKHPINKNSIVMKFNSYNDTNDATSPMVYNMIKIV